MRIITIKDCPICGAEVSEILYTTDPDWRTKLNCKCYDCHAEYTVYGDKRIYPFAGEWMETGRDAHEIWNDRYWEPYDKNEAIKAWNRRTQTGIETGMENED